MSILSRDELESLDMARICKELTPLEEKLLEAYKELESEKQVPIADLEEICDENATLRAELEEANKLVDSLGKELSEVKEELGMYTGRQ